MDIQQIRKLIDSEDISPNKDNIIDRFIVDVGQETQREIIINQGWDIASANQCDKRWGHFNLQLMNYVKTLDVAEEARNEILVGLSLEDFHWDWLVKSCVYKTSEYHWFYLIAEEQVEAVCLMFQPKSSVIDSKEVFYIEFLSVAPWNRNNPMEDKKIKGLGKKLLSAVTKYSVEVLGLRPGFSLHSLPKAEGFYTYIGMLDFPEHEKQGMKFFEMPEVSAQQIIGA